MESEYYPHYFLVNRTTKDSIDNRLSEIAVERYLNSGYEIVDLDTFYKLREKFFKQAQARIEKTQKQRMRRMLQGKN